MAGKKYLLLTALHGTPFVPIIHRTSRECQRLDICWTIARWFKYHHNPTLRDLAVQISTSAAVNALLVLGAARVALFLNRNAAWMRAQRYFMGTVLGLLALKLLTEKKAAA